MIHKIFPILLTLFAIYGMSYAQDIDVTVEQVALAHAEPLCSGTFATHTLDHITTVPGGDDVRQFEANGGGVAINDLDNDGDLDIVLANHAGMNTILWNEGNLDFSTERMTAGESRAVNIVDIDGDGWNDLFFTRIDSAPNFWHNMGDGSFALELLPNIAEPLYSTSWADLDSDGDLELVGATYDAALLNTFGQEFLLDGRGGVYYYENTDGIFHMTRLAQEAQGLALMLVDTNNDERLDIVVGNDFAVPDYIWVQSDDGWQENNLFTNTTHSTMSYDFADLNNDGRNEIFSTDMKPYATDDDTMAAWQPIMESMMDEPHREGDPQLMENVLLMKEDDTFANQATDWGISASGWSWSGKFGDLDQDGWLDLYIVNGFIEKTMFGHLDNHELVEENQVFRNHTGESFELMPQWGLGSTSSGRGMSMADLDGDGDLDMVVNNLRNPAQLFENQLCEGKSLQVDLRWNDSPNTHAIGATLTLNTDAGQYHRQVKASSGYLSGDTSRVHFGFADDTTIESLMIQWSDGTQSEIGLSGDEQLVSISRD